MIKILNYGSCFAGSVAHCLSEIFRTRYDRISSVQHNRIDNFVKAYVEQSESPVLLADIDFKLKPSAQLVVDNQLSDVLLGKSLPYGLSRDKLLHPVGAVAEGVDLLLIDNFAELLFRSFKHVESNKRLYFHPDHIIGKMSEGFTLPSDRLSAETSITYYSDLLAWCRRSNPNALAIFLNFPIDMRSKSGLHDRILAFRTASQTLTRESGFGVVDLCWPVETDFKDPYHFTWKRYQQYAYIVEGLMRDLQDGSEFHGHGLDTREAI